MKGKDVLYNNQKLTLTRFWANNEACLWIQSPDQIHLTKMEFVGGYQNEYCIFIKNLSATELAQIILPDGSSVDIKKELENL
ncbi:MAG: hypothetical protein IJZ72_05915 [Oscillospiraceae bacterium]|nr:hypothetical protein [Oscillospiraceae bacterium]